MVKSAEDVFAETMTPEMIVASNKRAKELLAEYGAVQRRRRDVALTPEHIVRKKS